MTSIQGVVSRLVVTLSKTPEDETSGKLRKLRAQFAAVNMMLLSGCPVESESAEHKVTTSEIGCGSDAWTPSRRRRSEKNLCTVCPVVQRDDSSGGQLSDTAARRHVSNCKW